MRILQKETQNGNKNENERHEEPFIPWSFVALFLQEVMSMEKERIEKIKELGDVLAAYVKEFDDQRFLNEFYSLQRSDYFRNTLLRASKRIAAIQSHPPLLRYDVFCTVFFTPESEELRFDWKFARDLLCIRMLEWFYDHDEKANERMNALPEERDTENLTPAYTD
jgi:CRISPR-associated protein Cst1